VVPIVQRFFAPIFIVDYGSSQLQRDTSGSANAATEVTALESGTHRDARLERVVAELSRRFSLDAKRARAIRFLAEGGARNELPTELEVGEERVKQIITSIHRRLRTTRVDEIAHEVVLATLRGRSAFYDREPTHDPRRT
jgi:hypothetical protein